MRWLAWLAACACVGCGRLGFETAADAAADAAVVLGPWNAPSLVLAAPGELIDDVSLTADQLEIFVNLSGSGSGEVRVAERSAISEPWGALAPIPELAIDSMSQPSVSADGLTMYLKINRDESGMMTSTRMARGMPWSTPVVRDDLNTPEFVGDAGPRPDQLEIVVTFGFVDGNPELALLSRSSTADAWGGFTLLDAINTADEEREGCIAEGGLALYYTSTRDGSPDLFRAVRSALDQPFGPGEPITELNSGAEDSDAWVAEDGRTIYFTTARSGEREIWMATR